MSVDEFAFFHKKKKKKCFQWNFQYHVCMLVEENCSIKGYKLLRTTLTKALLTSNVIDL